MMISEQDDSTALAVTVSGHEPGPAVILLHGWGSRASLMTPLVRALSASFRVINVDLPGHGNAPTPAKPMDMDAHAQAVGRLLPAQGAHLIGHSNGGRIALFMASDPQYADLIKSLTLISPSGVRRPQTLGVHLKRMLARVLKAPFNLLPPVLREPGLDWLRHSLIWKWMGSSDYRSLSGAMRETFVKLVNTYLEDRLSNIRVPTLLFWGDADPAVVRAQIDVLTSRIPDCGLVVMPGAGHYGYLDQPEVVLEGTRHFLLELENGTEAVPPESGRNHDVQPEQTGVSPQPPDSRSAHPERADSGRRRPDAGPGGTP